MHGKSPLAILGRAAGVVWVFDLFLFFLATAGWALTSKELYRQLGLASAIIFVAPIVFVLTYGILRYIITGETKS